VKTGLDLRQDRNIIISAIVIVVPCH